MMRSKDRVFVVALERSELPAAGGRVCRTTDRCQGKSEFHGTHPGRKALV
jgi:hypothetical protein